MNRRTRSSHPPNLSINARLLSAAYALQQVALAGGTTEDAMPPVRWFVGGSPFMRRRADWELIALALADWRWERLRPHTLTITYT